MQIKENYSLKSLNTFGVDARAKFLYELNTIEETQKVLKSEVFLNNKFLLLGGGSNILFTQDFDGIVLKINYKGKDIIKADENHVYIKANAGETWDDFVNYCTFNNWGGLVNLTNIPGNVGTCPVQNIGAYGAEVKDTIISVEVLRIEDGELLTFTNEECKFGYRNSIFKNEAKNKYIITAVNFRLDKHPKLNTTYGSVSEELEKMRLTPSVINISKAIAVIRNNKLPNPKVNGNAGSFFKNPVISKEHLDKLLLKYPRIRYFKSDNDFKLAAGWLIEKCGMKGKEFGNAAVHHKQALVLINKYNAKGKEILGLANLIQQKVKDAFGVELEIEVNIV
ncbi:MAG: UDP-N-acetylmuramate dehydrogenase [Bacteroidota bacterium]